MSIAIDIYVFVCMSFVMVELFDGWVSMVCANDDYLRFIYGGNLGVLSYNM